MRNLRNRVVKRLASSLKYARETRELWGISSLRSRSNITPCLESSVRPPSAFSEGIVIPLPVISCHFIYPSAQHLSQDIVTWGLFLFPVILWDPLWETLCHLSMHPLGPEQHLACCRCRTSVCSGNDCKHARAIGCYFYSCSLITASSGSCCLVGGDIGRLSYWGPMDFGYRNLITRISFSS